MSLAAPLPPFPPALTDRLRWKQAAEDVYVATADDEFAGYIAVSGTGHVLHGAHAQPIGVFPTRHEAQDALREHLRPVRPAAAPAGAPRRGRRRPRLRARA
jgi:hypothetical protein